MTPRGYYLVQVSEVAKADCYAVSPRVPPDVAHMPRTVHPVKSPEPLIISWRGRQVRVRHDDPHLGPYTPRGAVIRSAMELASDVEGLQLFLVTALRDCYEVRVADDGGVIGLQRKTRP